MCPRKYSGKQLSVSLDSGRQAPKTFSWRGKVYRVSEVQECWRLAGAWWDNEGEKTFFRLRTESGVICELSFNHGDHAWFLERIED